MYAVLEYDKRAHVRRVREVYKLLPNISQHNRFGTACADGRMKNALNDSGEQTKQRALVRLVWATRWRAAQKVHLAQTEFGQTDFWPA